MEYTKGEWYLELRPADNVRRVRCGPEMIADVFGTNAEDEANAHLIASAPDLYETLKGMLEGDELDPSNPNRVWQRVCPTSETIIKAFKTLAKAEDK